MTMHPVTRTGRARLLTLPLLGVVMVLVAGSLGTALAASQTYYLQSTGTPISFLSATYPTASALDNFDPLRDSEPGLVLQISSQEHTETDPAKYQLWMMAPTGMELDGSASLQFWSAMKSFDPDKKGSVRAQLLDCDTILTDCVVITSAVTADHPWNKGSTDWEQHTVDFGEVRHTVEVGRSLAVKIVVRDLSHDDMWFAYNTTEYPSSLTLTDHAPPPTTTTTTTAPPATTTTTPPPTTTTITTQAPTTTIPQVVAPTTTTLPSVTASSTTTTPPIAAPTTVPPTDSQSVTTTTLPDAEPPTPEASAPQHDDVALAALPDSGDADRGGSRAGGTFSTALLDGLTLVVPPAVASALLSPLVLLEALVSVFATTGRELLVPLAFLVAGVAWVGGRRRDEDAITTPAVSQGMRHD